MNPRCFGAALLLASALVFAQEPPAAAQPEAPAAAQPEVTAAAQPEVPAAAAQPEVPAAYDEVPAAYDKDRAHAWAGFAKVSASSSFSENLLPAVHAEGGGLLARGAAHSAKVKEALDIGFTGQVALMSRTFNDSGEEVGDALIELDGGIRVADLFYFTLGYTTQSTAYEAIPGAKGRSTPGFTPAVEPAPGVPSLTTTYTVVPIGSALYKTTESGYYLLQLRVGRGRLSNDQNGDTRSVGYGGVRAVMQRGFGSKLQFLLGLGVDRFHLGDYENDDFVRLEFGLGFGL